MNVTNLSPDLERLDDDLDRLEEVLKPLQQLADTASSLPLLDKTKLYTLAAYTIESLLFASLRLNGVDAKNHAVFTELSRVRQYFEKIKKAETPPEPSKPRESGLNKTAAIRFLKADLADNPEVKERLAAQLAEVEGKLVAQLAKEKEESQAASASDSPKRDKKRRAEDASGPAGDSPSRSSRKKEKRSQHGRSKGSA